MTVNGIGQKRQAVELEDTTEKKKAKVTYGETVATMAKRRKRQTAVTIEHRTMGASTRLADDATANKQKKLGTRFVIGPG